MSRSDPADAPTTAEDLFADLPGFDVVDGELMPRTPRRSIGDAGERPVCS